MGSEDPLDLVTCEGQHDRDHPGRPPAERSRRLPGHALIPSDLTLERAEVIEPGLDLDDQQGARPMIEREKVDPTVRSTVDDLDLPRGGPAMPTKPSVDIGGAASMDGILDTRATGEHRRPDRQLYIQSQRVGNGLDQANGRVRLAALDLGYVPR